VFVFPHDNKRPNIVEQLSPSSWRPLSPLNHIKYLFVGCMPCTRAGYKPNAFPNPVFARNLFQSMLTIISYFPEIFLYLLSLWAIVCSISFVLYRRHGVVLHKPVRDSTPRGACSRRVDLESTRSRTVWRPNASYSRHMSICMSQGQAPLLSAFCR
jgi:hypothetical protein